MNTKLFFASIILFSVSVLPGCASLNSTFDCPMKPGVMCKSLDQVNTQVDQGTLGNSSSISSCKNCGAIKSNQRNGESNFTTPYPTLAMNPGDPIRYGETVMRIWLAPYQDKDGNYYQPSLLYTVVKPGSWIDHPVKAISSEGDNA